MERLFAYAVLFHPTDDERKAGKKSELLVPVTPYALFANEAAVHVVALRKHADVITDAHIEAAERLEVAVRPF